MKLGLSHGHGYDDPGGAGFDDAAPGSSLVWEGLSYRMWVTMTNVELRCMLVWLRRWMGSVLLMQGVEYSYMRRGGTRWHVVTVSMGRGA
jgi:hypothetical protein